MAKNASFRYLPLGFFVVLMVAYAFTSSSSRPGDALLRVAVMVGVGLVVVGVVVWQLRVKKRAEKTRIGETRTAVRGQLDAIASDILRLEGEVKAAGNEEAVTQFRNATETYAAAFAKLDAADTAAELTELATQLDVAIWQLDVTEALLDGSPLPAEPRLEPAAAPTPEGPQYQRRAGRSSRIGVVDMIVAMLEDGPMSRRAQRRWGDRHSAHPWRMRPMRMGPMRMGPAGMMGDWCGEDSEPGDAAMDVLRRRFAEGELSDEEFDAKRRKLEKESSPGDRF